MHDAAPPNRVIVLLIDLASALPETSGRTTLPWQKIVSEYANLVCSAIERLLAQLNSCEECNLLWSYRFFNSAEAATSSFSAERKTLQPVRHTAVDELRTSFTKRVQGLTPSGASLSSYGLRVAHILEDVLTDVDWAQYNGNASFDSFMDADDLCAKSSETASCGAGHSLMPQLYLFGRIPETASAVRNFLPPSTSVPTDDFLSPSRRAARSLLQLRGDISLDCLPPEGEEATPEELKRLEECLSKERSFRQPFQQLSRRGINFIWVNSKSRRNETRMSHGCEAASVFQRWFLRQSKLFHVRDLYSLLLDRRIVPVHSQTRPLEVATAYSQENDISLAMDVPMCCRKWSTVDVVLPEASDSDFANEGAPETYCRYFSAQLSFNDGDEERVLATEPDRMGKQSKCIILRAFISNALRDDEILALEGYEEVPQLLRPADCSIQDLSGPGREASASHFSGLMIDLAKTRRYLIADIVDANNVVDGSGKVSSVLICALTPLSAMVRKINPSDRKLAPLRKFNSAQNPFASFIQSMRATRPSTQASAKLFETFLPGIWPPKPSAENQAEDYARKHKLAGCLEAFASTCVSHQLPLAIEKYKNSSDCGAFADLAEGLQCPVVGKDTSTCNTHTNIAKKQKRDHLLSKLEAAVQQMASPEPTPKRHSDINQLEFKWRRKRVTKKGNVTTGRSDSNGDSAGKVDTIAVTPVERDISCPNAAAEALRHVPDSESLADHARYPNVSSASDRWVHPEVCQSPWMCETATVATTTPNSCKSLHEEASSKHLYNGTKIHPGNGISLETAIDALRQRVVSLATHSKKEVESHVRHCMHSLSTLARMIADHPPNAFDKYIEQIIRTDRAVTTVLQGAQANARSSNKAIQGTMQPDLWATVIGVYEQVVLKIAKNANPICEGARVKRRTKHIRRCLKKTMPLLSCVRFTGEVTPTSPQSLTFFRAMFSQFFSDVLAQFSQGCDPDAYMDLLEYMFEDFEEELYPPRHPDLLHPAQVLSQSLRSDQDMSVLGTVPKATQLVTSAPEPAPVADNVSSQSLTKRPRGSNKIVRGEPNTKRQKLRKRNAKHIVAQARNQKSNINAIAKRSQFSRHVEDISRAKNTQRPLSVALEKRRHQKVQRATEYANKEKMNVNEKSMPSLQAPQPKQQPNFRRRPPVKRTLLGAIKECDERLCGERQDVEPTSPLREIAEGSDVVVPATPDQQITAGIDSANLDTPLIRKALGVAKTRRGAQLLMEFKEHGIAQTP